MWLHGFPKALRVVSGDRVTSGSKGLQGKARSGDEMSPFLSHSYENLMSVE